MRFSIKWSFFLFAFQLLFLPSSFVFAADSLGSLKFILEDPAQSNQPVEIEFKLFKNPPRHRKLLVKTKGKNLSLVDKSYLLSRVDYEILKTEKGFRQWKSFNRSKSCKPRLQTVFSEKDQVKIFSFCPLAKKSGLKEKRLKSIFKYIYENFGLESKLKSNP